MTQNFKPFRVKLETAGSKLDIDFRAHEKEPTTKVVIKSANADVVDDLILMTGVNPEVQEGFQGSHYWITVVTKDGAAKLLAALVTLLVTKGEAAALATPEPTSDGDEDGDAGDDDSVH